MINLHSWDAAYDTTRRISHANIAFYPAHYCRYHWRINRKSAFAAQGRE